MNKCVTIAWSRACDRYEILRTSNNFFKENAIKVQWAGNLEALVQFCDANKVLHAKTFVVRFYKFCL
jgi:hypothetical protein